MAWSDLFAALALYLVIEGLLPFVSPEGWRRSLQLIAGLTDSQLRVFGLSLIVVGLLALTLVRASA